MRDGWTPEDLARAVVTRVAPAELPLFAAIAEAGPGRRRRWSRDRALGDGLTTVIALITPVALLIANSILQSFGDTVVRRTQTATHRLYRRITRRHRAPAEPESRYTIVLARSDDARTLAVREARKAGLTVEQAQALADALIDALFGTDS